jgi:hypothetical protein
MSRFLSGFAGEPFSFFPGFPGHSLQRFSDAPAPRVVDPSHSPVFRFSAATTARRSAKFFGFPPLAASPKERKLTLART